MHRPAKVALAVLFLAGAVLSDGFIIFPLPYPTPLAVRYHRVTCAIDNGVAQTTIDQVFVNNTSDELLDGRYVFPVPDGASVGQFSVTVDGATNQAELMDAQEASQFFQDALRSSGQATLLAYTGNSAYTLRLANIPPGAERRIQISYVEVLPTVDGLARYLYPLNTEKFSMDLIDTVSIDVTVHNANAITSVYSPTHLIAVERVDRNTVTASYTSYRSRPNRDFELYYKLSSIEISFHLFTYKESGSDGYFLMLVTPQFRDSAEQTDIVAKDMVFTIDRSGSMEGTKIEQARDALRFCVNRLRPADHFSIVAFDSDIITSSQELLIADAPNVQNALTFVSSIGAGGATNIAVALVTSLVKMTPSSTPHYIIFLTDGLPTAGITNRDGIVAMVDSANTTETRIFSVGFGYDVNTVLIDQISDNNGGFALYCAPTDNIEAVISRLYRMIESPVLTSPVVTVDGIDVYDLYPVQIPDLFEGSDLALYGRYRNEGGATVTLSGNAGSEAKQLDYSAYFPNEHTDYPFVPRLWATQKIAQLMADVKNGTLSQAEEEALVDSIKVLSLTYGIVTPYTSMFFTAPAGSGDQYVYRGLSDSIGAAANDMSNYQGEMQQKTNSGQTIMQDHADTSWYYAPVVNQVQNIGTKIFVYSPEGIWVDMTSDSTVASDTVHYGSDEYFALAAGDPLLRSYMTVGNQAVISLGSLNYVILDTNASPVKPAGQSKQLAPGAFRLARHHAGIAFSLPRGRNAAVVSIHSARGTLVRELRLGESVARVVWDGTNSAGETVAAGLYTAVYRSTNARSVLRFLHYR